MTGDTITAREMAETLAQKIAASEPALDQSHIRAALKNFLEGRDRHDESVPTPEELAAYLAQRIKEVGLAAACSDFAFLQIAAAHLWGTEATSHFAIVLREARVAPKSERMTEWDEAAKAIERLPDAWAGPMRRRMMVSKAGGRAARGVELWSASYIGAVARALLMWKTYTGERGLPSEPTGVAFEAFALHLHKRKNDPVSASSVGNYLSRIYSGFTTLLMPGFSSTGSEFVLRDWREQGETEGTPTKTADQLVSATALFNYGFELMEQGRLRRTRGMRAALDFRNGVLLSTAIALPQRARALSVLEFGRTLSLVNDCTIQVHIPGQWIKQPQACKSVKPFDRVFRNARLAAALNEYWRDFRPIFDEGALLFPSFHAPMQGISESQIGRLTGAITLVKYGVRIPIHRFRDNVATEICETMPQGGRLAPAVLGHRDPATASRHYDHSEGFQVACEYADHIDARRSAPAILCV